MKLEKPEKVIISVQDRKRGKYTTLTVYETTRTEMVAKIRKLILSQKKSQG